MVTGDSCEPGGSYSRIAVRVESGLVGDSDFGPKRRCRKLPIMLLIGPFSMTPLLAHLRHQDRRMLADISFLIGWIMPVHHIGSYAGAMERFI